MRVRIRPAAVVCLLSLVATTVGCGSGFETPEACFQSMRVAANNKDMRGICNCLTEESQEALAGMLVLAGSMMSKMPPGMMALAGQPGGDAKSAMDAVNAVLEKHGVTEEALKEKTSNPMAFASADGIRGLASMVDDKVAFIADMYAALEPLGQTAKFNDEFTAQVSGELKDVKIEGDQATAVVVTSKGEEPLAFRKTPGGWKIHIEMGPMGMGGPPA